jgi:hypothetical protein
MESAEEGIVQAGREANLWRAMRTTSIVIPERT